MGEGKTPPAVPSSHSPPPAEVRPQGSPSAEVTDAEQLKGGGGGLVSADPLQRGAGEAGDVTWRTCVWGTGGG